jgi:PAS domain S-box-containing protein
MRLLNKINNIQSMLAEFEFELNGSVIAQDFTASWQKACGLIHQASQVLQEAKEVLECRDQSRICGNAKEMSERDQSREQLEAARIKAVNDRNLLEAVMESLPVGLAIIDSNGGITRANQAYEQIWGGPRPVTQSVDDYIAYQAWWPDTGMVLKPEEWASARAVQKGETIVGQLIEIMRFDGSRLFIHNSAAPIFDARGYVVGSAVAVMDVSEQIETERTLCQALKEAEEGKRILNCLMEYVPEGLAIVDLPDMKIRMVSRAGQEMLVGAHEGITIEDVVREWKVYHSDGITPMEVKDLPLSHAIKNGEVIRNQELIQMDSDGRCLNLLCNAAPILDSSGNTIGGIAAWLDITERKRAEEALRELSQRLSYHVDNSPLAVIEWGPDMQLIRWSGEAERIFGWKAEEVLGKRIEDFRWVYEEDEGHVAEVSSDLQRGTNVRRFSKNRNYHKNGSIVFCEWYNSSLLDDAGNLQSILSLVLNVTERTQAEDALVERQEQLEELNRTLEQRVAEETKKNREKDYLLIQQSRQAELGEMLNIITHQWRNPLNIIGLHVQMLKETYDHGNFTREFLEITVTYILNLIMYMSKTIDDFRNFLRPDREKKTFNLKEIISNAYSLISESFRVQNIFVDIKGGDDTFTAGYPNEYMQVVLNILNNARDAIVERNIESPRITIKIARQGNRSIVTIADNAGGIPEELLERIFEPYFTTKNETRGSGIGLYMAKTIIEKNMQGCISVRNYDEGAEFRIEV